MTFFPFDGDFRSYLAACLAARGLVMSSNLQNLDSLMRLLRVLISSQWKSVAMLSLTHGQPATTTTFGKEMGLFGIRLVEQLKNINSVCSRGYLYELGH